MAHSMRKTEREITREEARTLLVQGAYGILATCSADGQPYGVPMSYALEGDRVYLHGALVGHKMENLAENHKVSFTVVGSTELVPSAFTTRFESVVVFGRCAPVEGEEKRKGLVALLRKYAPEHLEAGIRYVEREKDRTAVLAITVEHMTGKARRT